MKNTIRTVLTIIIWGATGPLFGYSDIWQLVINTGTTFVNGVNELKSMKWGLVPSWSPDRSIGNHMINARAETITDKPSYRRLVESKCCLIPTDGFMNGAEKEIARLPSGFT
jgi:putative SOS response-associated peptidase YedK